MGQEAIHGKEALLVELDEARQVARWHAGAGVAALDGALLRDEVRRGHGPRRRGWRQSRGDRRAAAARDAIRGLEGSRRSRHLDRVVDAAFRRGLYLVDYIGGSCIECVRRAELFREL